MNFYFPEHRALCMAENATHNLHNLLTLRGARGARRRGTGRATSPRPSTCSATTPTSPSPRTTGRPGAPRPSSTLPHRAARPVRLPARPDAAADEPGPRRRRDRRACSRCRRRSTRRGTPTATTARSATTSRPIYQRYLGWYDGNPAHLWQHPPARAAAALRRRDRRRRRDGRQGPGVRRRRATCASPPSCSATWCSPSPDTRPPRRCSPTCYDQLGYGAENATWRNCYLLGAQEVAGPAVRHRCSSAGMASALTVTQLFDSLAIRIDGPRAWDDSPVDPLGAHRQRGGVLDGAAATVRWSTTRRPAPARRT